MKEGNNLAGTSDSMNRKLVYVKQNGKRYKSPKRLIDNLRRY